MIVELGVMIFCKDGLSFYCRDWLVGLLYVFCCFREIVSEFQTLIGHLPAACQFAASSYSHPTASSCDDDFESGPRATDSEVVSHNIVAHLPM